jgi:hypothetical protein
LAALQSMTRSDYRHPKVETARRMLERGWHPLLYCRGRNRPQETGWAEGPPSDVARSIGYDLRFNLGWRMGLQPNGKRIIGIDDDGGLEELERVLGALPPTWTQKTPHGGTHSVFTLPIDIPVSNQVGVVIEGKRVKVDVKCDRGALCIAPSEVLDGVYEVVQSLPLAPLPERWLAAMRHVPEQPPPPLDDITPSLTRALAYCEKCEPAISGSGGHAATFRVALKAREFGLDLNGVLAVLRRFNERCMPKWSEKDLRHKAESALQQGRVQQGAKLCSNS